MSLEGYPCSYPPSRSLNLGQGGLHHRKDGKLNNKSHRLVCKAVAFFSSCPPPRPVTCIFKQSSPELIIKEVFEKNFPGCCIGELHTHWSPKHILNELWSELHTTWNVTTLFLELIKHDIRQDLLDAWSKDSALDPPQPLLDDLQKIDDRYELPAPYSYTHLVKEAKKAHIHIVAIDSSAAAQAGVTPHQPLKENERIAGLNYTAKKIMEKYKGERFIILAGANHASRMLEETTPGLAEIKQCPSIFISDTTYFKKEPKTYPNPAALENLGFSSEPGTVHSLIVVKKPPLLRTSSAALGK